MPCGYWKESKAESKRKRGRATVRDLKLPLGKACSLPWVPRFGHQVWSWGFPGSSDSKEFTCRVGDLSSIPGLGRFPRGEHGYPLQYSCLENPHGQKSLVGYSAWSHRVGHIWPTKPSTVWSWVASAVTAWSRVSVPHQRLSLGCSSECGILTLRWEASDKALALQLCRNEFPQRQKIVKQVKYLLRGKRVHVDDTQAGSERVEPSWWFKLLLWGIPSGFPLTNHLALHSSESVFGISQDPPMSACTSLSKDGF